MNFCDVCYAPADKCQCAERMKWISDAARAASFSMEEMGAAVANLQKAMAMSAANTGGPIFGAGGGSGNASQFRLGGSGVTPPTSRRPPYRTEHERIIAQLTEGAIDQGVDEDAVRDAVRKIYARAAVEDQANQWIEARVRSELKKLVQTDVHNLAYDEVEDTAVIGCDEFLSRVQPHERFASWNDAAAATAIHFGSMREEVDRIRNLGYSPTITVYEVNDPGRGVVSSERETRTVVCCALAGVDVRFRIKVNQSLRMKKAVEESKMSDMLKHGLEKRKSRADEDILQAIQSSMKKGR